MLSGFEVTRFRLTAGRLKFGEIGVSRQIFTGGVKKSQLGFKLDPTPNLCANLVAIR